MQTSETFIEALVQRTLPKKARLALPEGEDPRVIEATRLLLESGVPKEVLLFGKLPVLNQLLTQAGISDARVRLIDSDDKVLQSAVLEHFRSRAIAKGKDLNAQDVEEIGKSVLNQAAYFLATSQVDAAVGGCTHTTADVIRASLKGVGMKPGIKTLSGSFAMIKGEENFMFGDCGVVADPTAEQLADIAEATAETFQQLFPHTEARLAFLSFSTKGSADHPRVQKMADAAALFKIRRPDLKSDGELQFDAAYVASVGERKAPGSPVAGKANCFIFPDLDAGNISYKIAQRLGGFDAYGPILQGSLKPFLDLSRGANAQDIMVSGLLAIIRSPA